MMINITEHTRIGSARHSVCRLLKFVTGVGYRQPGAGVADHRQIVAAVAHGDHLLRSEPQVLRQFLQGAALVHPRRRISKLLCIE